MAAGSRRLRSQLFGAWGRFRRREYFAIAQRYEPFTMVPPSYFVCNLMIADRAAQVPGSVVECGVWKGGMSAGIAERFGPDRDYYLFDSFEGLPPAQDIDGEAAQAWQADTEAPGYYDNCAADEADARRAMALAGIDRPNIIKGWFEDTVPTFNSSTPIAVLRLDGDWYESTMVCLENLYPALAVGGVMIIDDYHTWDGCTRAVHDYFAREGVTDRISQLDNKVCFVTKRDRSEANGTFGEGQ